MHPMSNCEMTVEPHALADIAPPIVSTALDCQALRHYSDFDATSESGVSDLSSVKPVLPRILQKHGKCGSEATRVAQTCGARIARRRENEAFLSSLSMIVELDQDEVANMVWPDSIAGSSAFTKLFDDDSIRVIWDTFINLSEKEQAKLLGSLRQPHGVDSPMSGDDDAQLCPGSGDAGSKWRHNSPRPAGANTKRRSTKRGHRRPKAVRPDGSFASSAPVDLLSEIQSSSAQSTNAPTLLSDQKELRDILPARFYSVLNNSFNTHHRGRSNKCSRRNKRSVSTLDLCLISRVEAELRHVFAQSRPTDAGDWETRVRWTPTVSLLSSDHGLVGLDSPACGPLQLDAFERLLVHCVATYLGLIEYSEVLVCSGDRQLWVECRLGHPFQPPDSTFLQLLQGHFSLSALTS